MSFSEIKNFIQDIKKQGYSSTAYEVDMHAKISYSFINIIIALLGIPFALRIGRSGGMAMGIAISIAMGFFYWTFFAFCLSLGKGGVLPPVVAAWVANLAFGFLGLYMFLHVRQ
jgi:lipopolysaccharide export system permease protein